MLKDCVSPQIFRHIKDKLMVFDKPNFDEGRFIVEDDSSFKVLCETGDCQGVITPSGRMFAIYHGEVTSIYEINKDGASNKLLDIEGIFFDLKEYEDDYLFLLGHVNNKSIIKGFKEFKGFKGFKELKEFKKLKEVFEIEVTGLLFGSSINVMNDEIYVAGFDEDFVFGLKVINFAGVLKKDYKLNKKRDNSIISKINFYENYIILLVSGKNDSIIILNEGGSFKEISNKKIGLTNILDLEIEGSKINILDGNDILSFTFEEISKGKKKNNNILFKNFGTFPYAYLMYVYSLSSIITDYFIYLFMFNFLSITMCLIFIGLNDLKKILFLTSIEYILSYVILYLTSFTRLQKQTERVELLLNITLSLDYKKILVGEGFTSIFPCAVYIFASYPNFSYTNMLINVIVAIGLFKLIALISMNVVKKNKDVIIDLLKEEDEEIIEYVKASINILKKENNERVYVEVKTFSKVDIKKINKWLLSRSSIFNGEVFLKIKGDRIIVVVDFSKRDIRYSRFSILMDFISFVKRHFKIEEIQIKADDNLDGETIVK